MKGKKSKKYKNSKMTPEEYRRNKATKRQSLSTRRKGD